MSASPMCIANKVSLMKTKRLYIDQVTKMWPDTHRRPALQCFLGAVSYHWLIRCLPRQSLLSRLWEVQLLTYSLKKRVRWWGIMTCWGRMQQKASSTDRYDYSLMYRGQEGTEWQSNLSQIPSSHWVQLRLGVEECLEVGTQEWWVSPV